MTFASAIELAIEATIRPIARKEKHPSVSSANNDNHCCGQGM